MTHFSLQLATLALESPWNIIGLVITLLIVLIPLVGVLGVYFKLAKRGVHKPLGLMPLAKEQPMLTDRT